MREQVSVSVSVSVTHLQRGRRRRRRAAHELRGDAVHHVVHRVRLARARLSVRKGHARASLERADHERRAYRVVDLPLRLVAEDVFCTA